MKKRTIQIALAILLMFQQILPVFAGFSMVPSNNENRRQFNFELKQDETKEDSIVIVNNNESPLTLLLYGADATHSNQGSFALVNHTATQRTIGNWVKFKESTVTLEPGEKKEIPFSVTIPKDATPGNYAGGIAAETTAVQNQSGDKKNTNTGAGVVISSRLVVKLFVSIPGQKVVKYDWSDYSHIVTSNQKERFNLKYNNSGNTAIAVDPKIEISGLFDGSTQEIKIPGTTLLQNEQVNIPYEWDKKPLFGFFTAKATTTFWEYDIANNQNINAETFTKSISFWIIPWNIAGIVLAVIALIATYVVWHIVSMQMLKKSAKSYEVQENETLVSIAEKSSVSWKKLAKLNKLKAPYALKKGDVIQVPFKK